MKLAAFGFRSIPPRKGCAGADKYALELYPRLVEQGYSVIAYNRLYPKQKKIGDQYKGVKLKYYRTVNYKVIDAILHSLQVIIHIILFNSGTIVHIQGNNAFWIPILRLFGKKVFHSIDGTEWKREKWPWYAKFLIYSTSYCSAFFSTNIIFDNLYTKKIFEDKFNKKFTFIPFGCEVPDITEEEDIINKYNLKKEEYFLFVGRFIPDKGVHYLIGAFKKINTNKKLILVGGAPHQSDYTTIIENNNDSRIMILGFIYGNEVNALIKNAYAYIQPSDIEGLSPVILTVIGLGTPLICSDIKENKYIGGKNVTYFKKSNIDDLKATIERALINKESIKEKSIAAKDEVISKYSWDDVVSQHIKQFNK